MPGRPRRPVGMSGRDEVAPGLHRLRVWAYGNTGRCRSDDDKLRPIGDGPFNPCSLRGRPPFALSGIARSFGPHLRTLVCRGSTDKGPVFREVVDLHKACHLAALPLRRGRFQP